MKTYSHKFLMHFGRKFSDNNDDIRTKIRETEFEFSRTITDDFDLEFLIKITCEKFRITVDEYYSSFKISEFTKARQSVCYILYFLGARNKQINMLTGFKKSRISNSVKAIKKDNDSMLRIESIIKLYYNEKDNKKEICSD